MARAFDTLMPAYLSAAEVGVAAKRREKQGKKERAVGSTRVLNHGFPLSYLWRRGGGGDDFISWPDLTSTLMPPA